MTQAVRALEPGGPSEVDHHGPPFFSKGQYVMSPLGALTVLESQGSEQEDAAKKPAGPGHHLQAVGEDSYLILQMGQCLPHWYLS